MKSKGKLYTVILFILSLTVVFGGWFAARELLIRGQEEFLDKSGQVSLRSSGAAFLAEQDDAGEEEVEEAYEETIREILTVWENAGSELPHEPKDGQIEMEQAIEAGKAWITDLAQQRMIPEELAGCEFDKTSAKLCAREAQGYVDESMLSYWSVQYIKRDITISLIIHAVYGEVWRADITMNDREEAAGNFTVEELLKAAFPFIESDAREIVNLADDITYETLPKGLVYAAVSMVSTSVDQSASGTEKISFWLGIK